LYPSLIHSLAEINKGKEEVTTLLLKGKEHQKSTQIKDSQSTNEYTETLPTLPALKTADYYFQNYIKYNLQRQYKQDIEQYNIEDINKIIYNDNAHVVAVFKDYLIYEDVKELLQVYSKLQSKYLIRKLSKERSRSLVLSIYLINTTKALKQATKRRNKIRKLRAEEREMREEESTLFRTEFMNSLAKEDLSNSISVLPVNSSEYSQSEDIKRIGEMLGELNKSANEEEKTMKDFDRQVPLNKKIVEGVIDRKNIMTAGYKYSKMFSSNRCYETSSKNNPNALLIKSLDKFLLKRSSKVRNRTLTRLLTDAVHGVKTYDAENEEVLSKPEVKHNCFNIYSKKFKFKPSTFRREENTKSNVFTYSLNKEKKLNALSGDLGEKSRIVLSMSTRLKGKPSLHKDKQTSPCIIRNTPIPKKRIIISPKLKSN
jgi:hypothetical protein